MTMLTVRILKAFPKRKETIDTEDYSFVNEQLLIREEEEKEDPNELLKAVKLKRNELDESLSINFEKRTRQKEEKSEYSYFFEQKLLALFFHRNSYLYGNYLSAYLKILKERQKFS